MKKIISSILAISMSFALLTSCGGKDKPEAGSTDTPSTSDSSTPAPVDTPSKDEPSKVENAPMTYMSVEELKSVVDESKDGYVLLDVRKIADYETAHVKGSISADLDAAKEGDDESGIANLKNALNTATGSETGKDDTKIVLLCYSGKSYAQKGTDLLLEMGVNADNITTLEGGYKAIEKDAADIIEK